MKPFEVASQLRGASFPWWIAGGWAIDLFVGEQTREHGDTDVGILRRDQQEVRRHLSYWDLWAAVEAGSLRLWGDEPLALDVRDVWCRPHPQAQWTLQLQINEADGNNWVWRRDPSVTIPISRLIHRSREGIPFLAPEVQLLWKAKMLRERDEHDFETVLPLLAPQPKDWLARHLPSGHPWLRTLRPL